MGLLSSAQSVMVTLISSKVALYISLPPGFEPQQQQKSAWLLQALGYTDGCLLEMVTHPICPGLTPLQH